MATVRIKRVYDPATSDDGFRVLVDRLWPRGVKKEALHYDLWAKEVAPSTELRQWYHQDPIGRWDEFRRRYLDELRGSAVAVAFAAAVSAHASTTLLYASRDTQHNHALVLQSFLEGSAGRSYIELSKATISAP